MGTLQEPARETEMERRRWRWSHMSANGGTQDRVTEEVTAVCHKCLPLDILPKVKHMCYAHWSVGVCCSDSGHRQHTVQVGSCGLMDRELVMRSAGLQVWILLPVESNVGGLFHLHPTHLTSRYRRDSIQKPCTQISVCRPGRKSLLNVLSVNTSCIRNWYPLMAKCGMEPNSSYI